MMLSVERVKYSSLLLRSFSYDESPVLHYKHVTYAAYRMQGDASMVLSLERIKHLEDKNLLAGHIYVLLDKDQNQAQELFLRR